MNARSERGLRLSYFVLSEYLLILVLDEDGVKSFDVIHVQPFFLYDSVRAVTTSKMCKHVQSRSTYTQDAMQLRHRPICMYQVIGERP